MEKEIQVSLPQDVEGAVVQYAKIAECEEYTETELARWLEDEVKFAESVETNGMELIRITDLEEGIYRIRILGDETYRFSDAIVSIPTWDEEGQYMSYDVMVSPKYSKMTSTPDTGDESEVGISLFFVAISFIIVMIISCHNRWRCGRM